MIREIVDKHDPEYKRRKKEMKKCKCYKCPHSTWLQNKYYCPFGAGCIKEQSKPR